MSLIDDIAKAVLTFKAEKPKTEPELFHDFKTAEYMQRVQQDAETADWVLRHGNNNPTNTPNP
jgi:hypothetical protein